MMFGLFLSGCLPANSLGKHDELETERYQLAVKMTVETPLAPGYGLDSGTKVAPFTWELVALMDIVYSRTFRDQSIGSIVEFRNVKSEFVTGDTRATAPSKLEGLLIELRTFDRGEVLALPGADGGLGLGGHMETLDLIWPLLVPHIQSAKNDEPNEIIIQTGWPAGQSRWLGYERITAAGNQTEDRQNQLLQVGFSGSTSNTNYVGSTLRFKREGEVTGNLTIDTQKARVVAAQASAKREVVVPCLGVQQTQSVQVSLTHLGAGPPIPMVPFAVVDSMESDALRLSLQDGRMVSEPVSVSVPDPLAILDASAASDCRALVPFVIFPDTWSDQERSDVLRGG